MTMLADPSLDPTKVMPAGAMPPKQESETTSNTGQAGTEAGKVAEPTEDEQKILGKFKDQDELTKSYQELESLHGRQSTEVGDLRKQNQVLLSQLELLQGQRAASPAKPKEETGAPLNYEAQLAEIQRQVDTGDIGISDALKLTADITAQRALALSQDAYAKAERERSTKQVQDQFLEQHPDFLDAHQSGELARIMKANPLHDEFSAYWQLKADKEAARVTAATQEGYQKGKDEVTKLAEGSEAARKVLSKPGADIRATNPNPPGTQLSTRDLKDSMAAALAKARGGG